MTPPHGGARRALLAGALATPIAGLQGCLAPGEPAPAPARQPTPAAGRAAQGVDRAEVVVWPDDGLAALLGLIRGAGERLDVYVFELKEHEVELALAQATRRGVTVRALVEPQPAGRGQHAWATMSRLRQSGVRVRPASPALRKTHAKALLADGARAWIGSANLVETWRVTRDYAVITAQPETVQALAAVFEADWSLAEQSWLGALRGTSRGEAPPPGSALVVSPANGRQAVAAFIRGAARSLHVQHSRLDDPHILDGLAERSLAGVDVRVVLDAAPGNGRTRRALRKRAPAATVRLVDRPAVHAKVLIADGARMLLGSHNLTRESLDERREIGVLVEDAAAVARVDAVLRRDLARGRGGDDG